MMDDDMDFLLRPVMRGMCRFESIKDGTLDLADFCLMNDALDVDNENTRRAHEANRST